MIACQSAMIALFDRLFKLRAGDVLRGAWSHASSPTLVGIVIAMNGLGDGLFVACELFERYVCVFAL
jgi:hypothetical protein